MCRVSLCLAAVFALACIGTTDLDTTIQVQGTVTEADDGSPIAGASVEVSILAGIPGLEGSLTEARTRVQTNNQGDYSLSFIETGFCPERSFLISASAQGFQSVAIWGFVAEPDETHVRCTNELQTIDFQLERLPPTST